MSEEIPEDKKAETEKKIADIINNLAAEGASYREYKIYLDCLARLQGIPVPPYAFSPADLDDDYDLDPL